MSGKTNKNKKLRLLVIIAITYLAFFAGMLVLAQVDYSTPMRIDLNKGRVYLRSGLERNYLVDPKTDPDNWVELTGKSYRIRSANLPDQPERNRLSITDQPVQYYTYLFEFDISPEQMAYLRRNAISPGIFLASIADNWEIYINGNLIVRNMYLDEDGEIIMHRNLSSNGEPFDKNYLKDGKNVMMIHIAAAPNYNDAGLYINGEYFIDEYKKIQLKNNDIFLLMFAGISVFMGFYNLMIFINNSKEKYYLHFSLIQFLLGIYVFCNSHYPDLFITDSRIQILAEFMTLCIMPIIAVLFTKSLAQEKPNIPIKLILVVQLLVALAMPFVGMQFMLELLYVGQYFMLFDLLYSLIISIRSIRRNGYVFLSVQGTTFIGFLIVLVTAVVGVVISSLYHKEQNQIIIGLFAFVISISFSLINDVIETKQQIAKQNEVLEIRVADRTRELEEQTKLALSASETKSNFLATMSHEIRTPMNAIIGIAEIERRQPEISTHMKDVLNRIYKSARELLGIINDILDLSKVTTGKMEILPVEYELPSMIYDSAQLNSVRIGKKPITFLLKIDERLPRSLWGDELRIKQVLNNVLSNAIKYTNQGTVSLEVGLEPSEDKNSIILVFRVTDTGQGMKPEQLTKLFDEYSQFNLQANRTVEGTGLGMSITYRLVALMQGTIGVESTFGEGSTFTIKLPQQLTDNTDILGTELSRQLSDFTYVPESAKEQEIIKEFMPYGKVLVVDDVETNLYVAEGLLADYGVIQEQASSGIEAIEKIKEGKTYDVIFMDHMMPVMDGLEAVRNIRALGYQEPIVALTANAIAGNAEMFLQNGFDGFISKPIEVKQLHTYMLRFVRDRHPGEGNLVTETANKEGDDRAAVVSGRKISKKLWEFFCKDGKKALSVLRQTAQNREDQLFVITAHGMKSALANIGRQDLSDLVKELEIAGRKKNWEVIEKELPAFLDGLEALLLEHKSDQAKGEAGTSDSRETTGEQMELLRKNLETIQEACLAYDEQTAARALEKLEALVWSADVREGIGEISLQLLHAEFEEAAEKAKGMYELLPL
jgi:signal transduction histidine kinase/DNA-binding response OmpR family regulator